jgi:hypothetical protein
MGRDGGGKVGLDVLGVGKRMARGIEENDVGKVSFSQQKLTKFFVV